MADISISVSFNVLKGTLRDAIQRGLSVSFVASAPTAAAGIASIGFAAHEALPMQDVTTGGWAFFENLDATNYVQVGVDVAAAFVPFLKLSPGESVICKLATNAPYAKSNTAATQLNYKIYQA